MKSFYFQNIRKHFIIIEPESFIAFGQQKRISEEQENAGQIKTEFIAFISIYSVFLSSKFQTL